MGLQFSISKASWSYSGFHTFRKKLALEIGINLDEMEGFGDGRGGLSWEHIIDPIKPFLNHSDCSGILTRRQAQRVGRRLLTLTEHWNPEDYDTKEARCLAKALIKAKRAVEFR